MRLLDPSGTNPTGELVPVLATVPSSTSGELPKDKEFREALKSYGSVEPELWDNANSNFDDVIKSLWKKARSGDLQTIKYLVDLGVMNKSEKTK